METDMRFLANIKIILTPNELRYVHHVISKAEIPTDNLTMHGEIFAKLEYLKAVIDECGETREL